MLMTSMASTIPMSAAPIAGMVGIQNSATTIMLVSTPVSSNGSHSGLSR